MGSRIAHVAGMAGKQTQEGTVNTIVGLDPAGNIEMFGKFMIKLNLSLGPLFNVNAPLERLASGDAEYVEGKLKPKVGSKIF